MPFKLTILSLAKLTFALKFVVPLTVVAPFKFVVPFRFTVLLFAKSTSPLKVFLAVKVFASSLLANLGNVTLIKSFHAVANV